MELLSLKIIVLALSGVIRLFFGLIPILLARTLIKRWMHTKRVKFIISLLMYFGGGILLATCFLHMMPEVREKFKTGAPSIEIPLPEIVFIMSFFLVYLLEDVVHGLIHNKRKRKAENKIENSRSRRSLSNGTSSSSDNGSSKESSKSSNGSSRQLTLTHPKSNNFGPLSPISLVEGGGGGGKAVKNNLQQNYNWAFKKDIFSKHTHPDEIPGVIPRVRPDYRSSVSNFNNNNNNSTNNNNNNISSSKDNFGFYGGGGSAEKFSYIDPDLWRDTVIANSQMNLLSSSPYNMSHSHSLNEMSNPNPATNLTMTISKPSINAKLEHSHDHDHELEDHDHNHSHMPISNDEDDSVVNSIRNILIIAAISFHGIFEGMAIGLQTTEKDVWYLFMAVSLHECTILFCIGVELISSKTRVLRSLTYILIVSMVCPIGIAIGIIISENSFKSLAIQALVVGSLQGLAAGTLLYVTFMEIFAQESKKLKRKFFHILVAVLGFLLMASLEFLGGHNHGDHPQSSSSSHSHNHSHHSHPHSHHQHASAEDEHNHSHGHSSEEFEDHHGHSH